MKENKYDDERFFVKSTVRWTGHRKAWRGGEWSELQKLLPSFDQKRVLDLGCGYGWHCIYAAQNGAKSVLGIDISERMLAEARRKNTHPQIEYVCSAMEDLRFEENSFDVVISSLAFHYIKDFKALAEKISKWTGCGGYFCILCGTSGFHLLWFSGLAL